MFINTSKQRHINLKMIYFSPNNFEKKKSLLQNIQILEDYNEIVMFFLKSLEISVKRVRKMFIPLDPVILFLANYSNEINQFCPQEINITEVRQQ